MYLGELRIFAFKLGREMLTEACKHVSESLKILLVRRFKLCQMYLVLFLWKLWWSTNIQGCFNKTAVFFTRWKHRWVLLILIQHSSSISALESLQVQCLKKYIFRNDEICLSSCENTRISKTNSLTFRWKLVNDCRYFSSFQSYNFSSLESSTLKLMY